MTLILLWPYGPQATNIFFRMNPVLFIPLCGIQYELYSVKHIRGMSQFCGAFCTFLGAGHFEIFLLYEEIIQ